MPKDTAAVVLAAGSGRRLGGGNKALLLLGGEPLLAHSLRALAAAPSVAEITLVLPAADLRALQERYGVDVAALGATRVVDGGPERWLSSRNGCAAADALLPYLLVHDAARPLVQPELVEAVLAGARRAGAALAAEPLDDTLKLADADSRVLRTLPRSGLWRAQTPQAFRRELLLQGFAAWSERTPPTDECMLVEALGARPVLVPAPSSNCKVTRAADVELAEALLLQRRSAAT
ncbi:MAG: 2-C-methyl-D-erythritol 4-phosphate cytidylyltransferase [Planctomycetota bacterium]|nr:MAG: 2-C-methyl-D-erythritol 4-phosphate cytidylyltransferase [Planctomycetota bacterium]